MNDPMSHTYQIWQTKDRAILRRTDLDPAAPPNAVFIGEFQADRTAKARDTVIVWSAAGMPAVWPPDTRRMTGDVSLGRCGSCKTPLNQGATYWAWRTDGVRVAVCSTECRGKLAPSG